MNIGRVGIWSMALEAQPLSVAQEAAAELDELGFPALWIPEALGKEAMSHAALLLAATRRMVVATGIANLWARDATAMVNAQRTLTEGFPERFLLGIGVSYTPTIAHRGHTLVSPVQATVTTSRRWMPPATSVPPRLPAAPRTGGSRTAQLTLAAELTDGAHTTVPQAFEQAQ
jgi:alkanesulfonate monooxygenase SsuD/methylene tetrahydromethanopterin reductase-like flavin-dependent oxidoreductase (luciferase family)